MATKPVTIATVRRRLQRACKQQSGAFDKHIAKWNCKIDGTCLPRARYQGKLEALEFALDQLKRVPTDVQLSTED